ncbi:Ger(x)C family spore germination protein [Carboxydothermus hydrogenoformans]|uniref:Spore germination protein n=1 Tax=Carboxydothermus hydrogenoformans (strain ATCC BAA-161 / DSM 6008 / Z-2901) TaxID=246194 RepID=Q3AF84_CARHZ|nr:Ger(x)C family spore germination protein [Carboxydothermus hydrogenoformans]ABB15058.1 spore germination protein [Carboxydothermus hydrogenoformans Z-2901]
MKRTLAALLIIGQIFFFGCWSRMELEDLAIVQGVGVDENKKGLKKDRYLFSVQVVNPSALTSKGGGGGEKPYVIRLISGELFFTSLRELNMETALRLYYAHNRVILISEDVARRGLKNLLDFFERNPQFRRDNYVLIVQGKAVDVWDGFSGLVKVPAIAIYDLAQKSYLTAEAGIIELGDFIELLEEEGVDPYAPGVKILTKKGRKDIRVFQTALFKNDKLAGWLDEKQSRGLLIVTNKVKGGITDVTNPFNPEDKLSVELERSKTQWELKVFEDKPVVKLKVETEGIITEAQNGLDFSKKETFQKLNREYAKSVRRDILAFINKTKEIGADPAGFGRFIYRENPGLWQELKDDWEEEIKNLTIEVKVQAKIVRTGMTTASIKPQ